MWQALLLPLGIRFNGKGVKGVIRNGDVKLHISKVTANGSFSWSTIIDGVESCVTNEANVIYMSVTSLDAVDSFQDAITDAYNSGMLIFAPSGNDGRYTHYEYPAAFDNVVSVASVNESKTRSFFFSTANDRVNIAAPGDGILTTHTNGGYLKYSGTSMACAHAAGVAALVWSTYPSLSHEQLVNILERTAEDLPEDSPNGYDNY